MKLLGLFRKTKRSRPTSDTTAVKLRVLHPDWTLQKISDKIGISKERVRQLLVKHNLSTINTGRLRYRKHGHFVRGTWTAKIRALFGIK